MKTITAIVFLIAVGSAVAYDCPKVETQENFNLNEFIRERWYVQAQQEIKYLPKEQNYCVIAEYSMNKNGKDVDVHNIANEGLNGKKFEANLCAVVRGEAKLAVGPCFLKPVQKFVYGDYFVVAAGPSADNYEWAVISGGNPTIPTENGKCKNGDGTNGSGLWLFTRQPTVDKQVIADLTKLASDKGFDVSVLNPVVQEGCNYEGGVLSNVEKSFFDAYPALRGSN